MSKIGKNIKKIRNVKGISQQAFGEVFDLTRGNISSYEEMRAEPKIDILLNIAKYFGISMEDFIEKELSVNELLHYNTELVLETERLKRNSQLINIPFVSVNDVSEYIDNYQDPEFAETMPHIVMPSSSTLPLLAIEVYNTESYPTGFNYKVGDILVYERVVKENLHRIIGKLGLQVDDEGLKNGFFDRTENQIILTLNEWVKYTCQIESKSCYWVLRAVYSKVE